MQLPLSLSRYSALPFSTDSAFAVVGFFVLSASAGSSHVFFEKSCCCCAPAPEEIERLSFWFLFVVVELFAFCADDVIAISNEVTKITATASDNENTRNDRIGLRIGCFLLNFSWSASLVPLFSSLPILALVR